MLQKSHIPTAVFLNSLKWKTYTEEFHHMRTLRIDCYLFQFKPAIEKDQQYAMIEYMESLDLTKEASIIKLSIWLHQNHIPFKLKFQYNPELPLYYNWYKRKRPKRIFKSLKKMHNRSDGI